METSFERNKRAIIRDGLIAGMPIVVGYLPIAIAYGVLAKQSGLTLMELTGMSLLVYAGAAQFMGAGMIGLGTGAIEIIIATFVLNFRHFVMSLSLMNRIRIFDKKWKLPLAMGLTDETFSVASIYGKQFNNKNGQYFYLTMMLSAYLSWVLGSLLGGLLGDVIPHSLSQSMGVALYAMFIGLLVPSIRKETKIVIIAVIAMVSNFIATPYLGQGWSIVLGTIVGAIAGVFVLREEGQA
ncbi:AzlC family ABC transporter permease [Saliterribacillus persicus]|uniref:4-azaleucine resistance transporter AzlC n=1 Tax=Saliterribacillus persicus TaxID=930114 RepID=A0A368XQ29_9BACI|nr:AzlC family ABC transporter permease [Saliterribacillus persicus]RCW69639.1 4-azaleucine resistance transporter AzlC [Saliterribacillus persicus]